MSCGTGGDPVSSPAQTSPLPAICVPTVHHGPSRVAGGWARGRDASLPGAAGWMLGSDRSTRTDGYDGCSQSENRTRRSPSAGAEPPDTQVCAMRCLPLRGLALATVGQGRQDQAPGRRARLRERCSPAQHCGAPCGEQAASSPCKTCPDAACRCPATHGSWSARRSEGTGALGEGQDQKGWGEAAATSGHLCNPLGFTFPPCRPPLPSQVPAVRKVLIQRLKLTGNGGSRSNRPKSCSEPTPSTWRYLKVSSLEAQHSRLLFTALRCSCQTT